MTMPQDFKQILNEVPKTQRRIVTMLTDFGTSDGFVGVMKGVIFQIAPQAHIVDITHDIPPQSVEAASFLIEWAYGYFPSETVHLCVVDPGVGTSRRMMVLEYSGHYFVAPDNGVLTPLLNGHEPKRMFAITNANYWLDRVSNTFHGRDIFSPVAAHLARGVDIQSFGSEFGDPVLLDLRKPVFSEEHIDCQIVYIDRFGNLVTNVSRMAFEAWTQTNHIEPSTVSIQTNHHRIFGLSNSYGEKSTGQLLAVFDGFDRLEISVRNGHAASVTGLKTGDKMSIVPR